MLTKVARSKILFFDSNPIGRILARFSKDIAVLDGIVPLLSNFAGQGIFRTISVFITLAIVNPFMLIPIFFGSFIMVKIVNRTLPVMNDAQTTDGVHRGPLNSNFTNAVSGLVTLRTFDRLKFFQDMFINDLDKSCNATFTFMALQRGMNIKLDVLCALLILFHTSFTIW